LDDHLFGEAGSLWIKTFTVSADKVKVRVAAIDGLPPETVVALPDNLIYASDGTETCQIRQLVDELLQAAPVRDYFLKNGTEEHKWAEIVWEPGGVEPRIFMKKLEPPVLRRVESVRIVGPCKVEISQFGLRHSKLGDVHVVWGKASIAGQDALAVGTVAPSGAKKLSINFSTLTPKLKKER
jgi:hypothetical protein